MHLDLLNKNKQMIVSVSQLRIEYESKLEGINLNIIELSHCQDHQESIVSLA